MWRYRIKALFTGVKLPGWLLVAYFVFREVADFHSRITFWSQVAKDMSGYIGVAASVIASPWFNFSVLIIGIVYILFVGEPRQVVRHSFWPIFGWVIFGTVALVSWSLFVAGYVLVHAPQQSEVEITARVNDLVEKRLQPRTLTDDQRKELVETLRHVPLGETYKLYIAVISSCNECSVYADDLISTWKSISGWNVTSTTHFGLNPRLNGVTFVFDPSRCPSGEIQIIKNALGAASIRYRFGPISDEDKKVLSEPCNILVGTKPQK